MFAAGAVLAYDPGARFAISPHAAAIVLACALWALDNNLTRRVAAADPVQTAAIKGLAAGSVNLALGLGAGAALPAAPTIAAAAALGFASYGVSLVLFIYALRHLGSARTGAHFGTAPFIGAAVAVPLLGEPVTAALLAPRPRSWRSRPGSCSPRLTPTRTRTSTWFTPTGTSTTSTTGTRIAATKGRSRTATSTSTSRSATAIRTSRTSITATSTEAPGCRRPASRADGSA